MAREWSYWTRNKLEILAGYLPAFNRASQTSRERIYLDLMAGQPENIDRDMGEKFDGSSLIAMKADPPFTRLRFCELNPLASELDVALRTRFPGDGRYRVVAGDSNVTIDETLAELGPWRWAPTFAFIDQQAAEVHWETINKVAAFRQNPRNLKTELWMLMSPTMIARGVKGTNAELFIEQVTRMYGDADWKRIQAARWRHHLTAPAYCAEMVNLMRVKLEYELGYKYSHRIPMQMHNKVTIFDMVFATDHWAGDAIMCHLYNRAAQKGARDDAASQERETAEGVRGPWRDGIIQRWRTSCPGFERWADSVGAVANMGSACTRLVVRGSGFLISISGISSQQRPSSSRPNAFGVLPPHCLKKNGTSAAVQVSRIWRTHCGSIGRKFGPDSPPAITQSIEPRFIPSRGPSNGSQERNLTAAGTCRRSSIRRKASTFSTDTPIQTFEGHSSL